MLTRINTQIQNLWSDLKFERYLGNSCPILVYQMGKVGSSSIYSSLVSKGYTRTFHIHRLSAELINSAIDERRARQLDIPEEFNLGARIYRQVVESGKRHFRVITPVREPIARSLSVFLQDFQWYSGQPLSADISVDVLLEQVRNALPPLDQTAALAIDSLHERIDRDPYSWFTYEMEKQLGVDVFAHPFPQEQGHLVISKEGFDLLLLKIELEDEIIARAIGDFIGEQDFHLVYVKSPYSSIADYQQFKARFRLPESQVRQIYSSPYMRHFYTDIEIEAFVKRWSHQE